MNQQFHQYCMRRALHLAARALGQTRPNPAVGCVVARNGTILGEGYHTSAGEPHAEIMALHDAKNEDLQGSTVYVTLEPCHHSGRTGPCTQALIAAGVRTVYIAMPDPNPGVIGGGIQVLRNAGMEVHVGLLAHLAHSLNAAWIKWITTGYPYVILKMGMSLDGKVATASGESKWVTGTVSRSHTHRWRRRIQAIMAGRNTIEQDDPALNARKKESIVARPVRIVTDSSLTLSHRHRVFHPDSPETTIILTTLESDHPRAQPFLRQKCRLITLPKHANGIDLRIAMKELGAMGIENMIAEGGPSLAYSLLAEKLVDRVMMYQSMRFIGGQNAPSAIGGSGFLKLSDTPFLSETNIRKMGTDWLITGDIETET